MRVVVDNREGADPHFVGDLRAALLDAGCEVEMRDPLPQSVLDTTVHFIVEGVAVRVAQDIERSDLDIVIAAVRAALARRGAHQRFRAVPIYRAETNQVLAWVDVFD